MYQGTYPGIPLVPRYPGTRVPGTRVPGTRVPVSLVSGTRVLGIRNPGIGYPGTRVQRAFEYCITTFFVPLKLTTTLTAAAVGSKTGGDSCGTDVAAASDIESVSDKKHAAQPPVCFGKINWTFLLQNS